MNSTAAAVLFVSLVFSLGASAAEPPSCKDGIPQSFDIDPKPDQYSGFAIVHLDNDMARTLYSEMTEVWETRYPHNSETLQKLGKSISCFKQVVGKCAVYQCNLGFANLRAGEVLKK
jgi:hypothetical protein